LNPAAWTPAERGELAARLRVAGTTITEVSDAREFLGLPRLSESDPVERAHVHLVVDSSAYQTAIATVRAARLELVADLERTPAKVRAAARKALGLGETSRLRLGELRALYARVRALEIEAEPARQIRPIEVMPVPQWTEEELFGPFAAAGGAL
jgi:hypothetical protein